MQGMTCNRNGRAHIVLCHGLYRWAARARCSRFRVVATHEAASPAALDGERDAREPGCGSPETRERQRSFRTALIYSICPLSAGCRAPLSALDPEGPAARSIATLWWSMFVGAAVLFALVMGLLWWAYRKPGFGTQSSQRTWVFHAGVIMPGIILTALAGFALVLGERLVARGHDEIVQVDAIATRWAWHFRYPQIDSARSSTVLHIPAGRPVEVRVVSEDVIHSFWVPRLAGKIDAIPGHENRVQLLAERAGHYEGVCAEFCGLGHAGMRFRVVAHDVREYEAVVREGTR